MTTSPSSDLSLPAPLQDYVIAAVPPRPGSLAAAIVTQAHGLARDGVPLGISLAAGFDLLVAAKYYDYVQPENWLWCQHSALDLYPFLNACPTCVLEGRFVHHAGNKPQSGHIGPATAEALREMLVEYYHRRGSHEVSVCQGREPVDIAIVDYGACSILVAEVKASPLFTPPLAIAHSPQHFHALGTKPLKHADGTLRGMQSADPSLVVPAATGSYWLWRLHRSGLGNPGWAESALAETIGAGADEYARYVQSWRVLWDLYVAKDASSHGFWHTGACGLPNDPGDGWPRDASGKPKGSISDGKTSVGMDRTDDIKKSTFQVLSLGVRLRRQDINPWSLKIGLMSNLHAGRHHSSYLSPYEDIVWGWDDDGGGGPARLFRLFDVIASFSRSHTRDPWIREVMDWHSPQSRAT